MFEANNIVIEAETKEMVYRSGFTLIELLLVIALMAMIIGITVPAFVGLTRGAGMRGAVAQVSSTLSLLRQWSITKRENVTFHYYSGGITGISYYYADNSMGIVIDKTNELPMDVMFSDSGSHTFKPDGALVSAASPQDVIIKDKKSEAAGVNIIKTTIKINEITGGIYVE